MRMEKIRDAVAPTADFVEWREKGRATVVKRLAKEGAIPTLDAVEASLETGDLGVLALYLRNSSPPDPHLLQVVADLLDPKKAGDRKLVFRRARKQRSGKADRALSQARSREVNDLEATSNAKNYGGGASVAEEAPKRNLRPTDRDAAERINRIKLTIAGIAETDAEMADALRNLFWGLEIAVRVGDK